MKEQDVRDAAQLFEAIADLPKVRRALTGKPGKFYDAIMLELSAAQMNDGVGQGSNHYFYLSPKLGGAILDAAERVILAEMKRLGLKPKKKR
jgi:hypothetical protein